MFWTLLHFESGEGSLQDTTIIMYLSNDALSSNLEDGLELESRGQATAL